MVDVLIDGAPILGRGAASCLPGRIGRVKVVTAQHPSRVCLPTNRVS